MIAIAAFVIAFLIVLNSSGTDHHSNSTTPSTNTVTRKTGTNTTTGSKFAHRRSYTIKPGDTLGAIAIKTGVSVSTLEDLNPGLDPQGLVAGQKLKLRE